MPATSFWLAPGGSVTGLSTASARVTFISSPTPRRPMSLRVWPSSAPNCRGSPASVDGGIATAEDLSTRVVRPKRSA